MSAIPGSQIKEKGTYERFPITVQFYTSFSKIRLSDTTSNIRGERQRRLTPSERLVAYEVLVVDDDDAVRAMMNDARTQGI